MWELLSYLVLATSLDTFTWNMKVSIIFLLSNTEEIWEMLWIVRGKKHQCITKSLQCCKKLFYCGKCKLQVDSIHSGCIYSLFFLFKVTRRNMNSFLHFETFLHFHKVNACFIFANKMLYTVYFYCLTYIYTSHALFITANTGQLQLYVSRVCHWTIRGCGYWLKVFGVH